MHSRRDYSKFDLMSTEELENILNLHSNLSEEESSDIDAILYIMEVVGKRERENPSGRFTDADTAWQTFNEKYRPSADGKSLYEDEEDSQDRQALVLSNVAHKRGARDLLRAALVVAALIALLAAGTVSAYALGYDVWGAFAQWTHDAFGFVTAEPIDEAGPETYESIQDALDAFGIKEELAPKIVPDGYVLDSIIVNETPSHVSIQANYLFETNELMVTIIHRSDSSSRLFEKDEENVQIYEVEGIKYYIMSNNEKSKAVWICGMNECCIEGKLSTNEFVAMIDSIYSD